MTLATLTIVLFETQFAFAQEGGPPPALVRVATAEMQQVQQKRLITGRIQAISQSNVAAAEPGRVLQAPPDPGTIVKAGQVLVRVDAELLKHQRQAAAAQVAEAEAQISRVKADLALATRMRARFASLVPTDAASKTEFDQAVRDEAATKAELILAEAMLAQRRADLAAIDEQLDRKTIKAPFDGTIITKSTEVGEWLNQGGVVATLIATHQVDAVLDVPEAMVRHLARDAEVSLDVAASGTTPKGKVYRVVPSANRTARTFPVWVRVDNAEGKLMPGMSVDAELPTGNMIEAITVPRDAVQVTNTGAQLYAARGGTAVPVPVNIQFATNGRFVIQAPLQPGEQVVIEGNERLFPGQPLQIQSEQPPNR